MSELQKLIAAAAAFDIIIAWEDAVGEENECPT